MVETIFCYVQQKDADDRGMAIDAHKCGVLSFS